VEEVMPYASRAQQGYLHVHKPELAKEFDKKTSNFSNLPQRVGSPTRGRKSNPGVSTQVKQVVRNLEMKKKFTQAAEKNMSMRTLQKKQKAEQRARAIERRQANRKK
jgi:hypothetical protein